MNDFFSIAKVSDVPDPGKLLVEVDERLVALFQVGGEFYALDDVCTHDGGQVHQSIWKDQNLQQSSTGRRPDPDVRARSSKVAEVSNPAVTPKGHDFVMIAVRVAESEILVQEARPSLRSE